MEKKFKNSCLFFSLKTFLGASPPPLGHPHIAMMQYYPISLNNLDFFESGFDFMRDIKF